MSYNIVTIILALFLIVVAVNKSHNTEGFADAPVVTITSANVADYIYKIYRADVKAIQNLADIAAQLQAGGITCPGAFSVSNQLNVSGAITSPTITDLYAKITALESRCGALESKCSTLEGKCTALEEKTKSLSTDGNSASFNGVVQVNNRFIARGGIIQIGPNPDVYIRCGTEIWGQPTDPYVLAAAGKWSSHRVDAIYIHSATRNASLTLATTADFNYRNSALIYNDDDMNNHYLHVKWN